MHQYRTSIPLSDVRINVFSTADYPWGIQLQRRSNPHTQTQPQQQQAAALATFDARSQSDQQRLVTDLQESVAETLEMEKARMFLNTCAAKDARQGQHVPCLPVHEESLMLAPESFC